MLRIIKSRLWSGLWTLFGISILAFALIRLADGDPVLLLLGERGGSPELYQETKKRLGLDQPLVVQYMKFVKKVFSGDLGHSIVSKESVWKEFWGRFPATAELGLLSMFLAILLGIPLGVIAALKRNSFLDYSVITGTLLGYSMPIFWWALLLILFFSVSLGWTPVSGRIGVEFDVPSMTGFLLIDSWLGEEKLSSFLSAIHHLLLPVFALSTVPMAAISRMTRSSVLEVLKEDYVRTAKAKGLSFYRVVLIHCLKNALIPVVTIIGLLLGAILTGAILTETIFAWPGLGRWFVSSVEARDYPVIQGGMILIATLIILVNLTVDLIYLWLNPKLRDKK